MWNCSTEYMWGTTNYNSLTNLPQINWVELKWNVTGLVPDGSSVEEWKAYVNDWWEYTNLFWTVEKTIVKEWWVSLDKYFSIWTPAWKSGTVTASAHWVWNPVVMPFYYKTQTSLIWEEIWAVCWVFRNWTGETFKIVATKFVPDWATPTTVLTTSMVSDYVTANSITSSNRYDTSKWWDVVATITISSSDCDRPIEFKTDWTDSRVVLNPDYVSDNWYLTIPEGYFLWFFSVYGTDKENIPNVYYDWGNAGWSGDWFIYLPASGAPTVSNGNLWIWFKTYEPSEDISITRKAFDEYLAPSDSTLTRTLIPARKQTATPDSTAISGVYYLHDISYMNNKILWWVWFYPCWEPLYIRTLNWNTNWVQWTAWNANYVWWNVDWWGWQIMVKITPTAEDVASWEMIYYKFDWTDSRVEIIATALYDDKEKWFLINPKMSIWFDWRSAADWTTTNVYKYSKNTADANFKFHSFPLNTKDKWNTPGGSSLCVELCVYEESGSESSITNSDIIKELKENIPESVLKWKYFSILWDSISTFQWWSNVAPGSTSAAIYYPKYTVTDVNQTYRKKLADRTWANLLVNNSWSGSRVTNVWSWPVVSTSNDRCAQLAKNWITPDYIIINMGTNDFDHMVADWETWTTMWVRDWCWETYPEVNTAPTSFREAYAVMLRRILTNYPLAKVFCCTVPCWDRMWWWLNEINAAWVSLYDFNNAIREIATAYWCKIIELASIWINYGNKDEYFCDWWLHPNEAWFELYYDQIRSQIEAWWTTAWTTISRNKQMKGTATTVTDSTATDVEWIVTDFNSLLTNLRNRWVIS